MKICPSLRCFVTLVCVGLLTACSSITPAGVVAARQIDPLNTPPSELTFAIAVPKALRLADGDADLRMAFTAGSSSAPIDLEKTAQLQLRPGDASPPAPSGPDEQIVVARIAPDDAAAIAALQTQIRDLRARGIEGEGSLGVQITGGCFEHAVPDSIAVSTWIKTSDTSGFVQLSRSADLFDALTAPDAAELRASLTTCSE